MHSTVYIKKRADRRRAVSQSPQYQDRPDVRIVLRVSAAIAILISLSGCAAGTHVAAAIPNLPTCEKTLLELNHLTTSLSTKSRIPQTPPGAMRLCRYRWNNNENKLALLADITLPSAPVALLRTLSELKTLNGVYSPNAAFACPLMQGNADVIILQGATSSELKVIQVQRDGCGWVILTHPGSTSYVAYLGAARLGTQLDAINAPLTLQTKNLPKIRLTPASELRDGQQVLVQVMGASPGERFRISECAAASFVNVAGCGEQLAAQPFIDTDAAGSGSILFYVRGKAATKPYNSAGYQTCTVDCVIMATGTDIDGRTAFVYAPLRFSK